MYVGLSWHVRKQQRSSTEIAMQTLCTPYYATIRCQRCGDTERLAAYISTSAHNILCLLGHTASHMHAAMPYIYPQLRPANRWYLRWLGTLVPSPPRARNFTHLHLALNNLHILKRWTHHNLKSKKESNQIKWTKTQSPLDSFQTMTARGRQTHRRS